MATITKSLTIESQGTYNLTFDLWSYSEWAASAGITTSYASLAALIADEKAVRQLMTVHASVDYFANCPDSTIISTVINNDLCAKWINLRDYALDTLSAKSNIKSVMNTADKYGYGEWGKINSTTWGPLGCVPIMTANNAPYGTASASHAYNNTYPAWKLFDGDDSSSWRGDNTSRTEWVQYEFVNPTIVNMMKIRPTVTGTDLRMKDYNVQGSNDGTNFTPIYTGSFKNDPSLATTDTFIHFTNDVAYKIYRVNLTSTWSVPTSGRWNYGIATLQFYGRELKPLVPTMTGNTTPKGQANASSIFSATYPAFQAFDSNINDFWASSENTNDQWVEYDFVDTVKPYHYYIKPFITISGSTAYSKTAQVAVQGYVNNEWVNISGKTLVSNSTTTATNTTPSEIRGNITNPAEINKIRVNFGEKVGVQRDIIGIFQVYGMDYSEKEFAQGSTRKTIYDHGVAPSGAITGGTKNPDCLTLSAIGTATITIDKGTRKYMGGKAGLHASGTNRLKCGSGYSNFTASNMPDSNGLDISSISGSVAVGIEQTASGTFDCTEIWIE